VIAPTFSYLNDVYFGCGLLVKAASLVERYGLSRPLVVTDPVIKSIGLLERAGLFDYPLFDAVQTNPTEASVTEALSIYRDSRCDGFVAIGGGSPIDLAKATALLVNHVAPLAKYAILEGGPGSIAKHLPPLIVIPTTAGSGSEVGRAALITVADGRKLGFLSPKFMPVAALCDPEVTSTMPDKLSVATGLDAISHCVEAVLSPRFNPVAESLALDGLRRGVHAISHVLGEAVSMEWREKMMWCSLLGGMAFQKGLGAVHSLSHPLGRLSDKQLHHGTLNGLFLPAVLEYNATSCPDQMRLIASTVGAEDPVAFFSDLLDKLDMPRRLSEMGVTQEDLVSSAPLAASDHCTATNPRHLTEQDALELYRSCF
jgi:4-hydroxybutyrate dehydrogenase